MRRHKIICVDKEMRKLSNRYSSYRVEKSYLDKNNNEKIYKRPNTTLTDYEMYCVFLEMTPNEILCEEKTHIHFYITDIKLFIKYLKVTYLENQKIFIPLIVDTVSGTGINIYVNWDENFRLEQALNSMLEYEKESLSTVKNLVEFIVTSRDNERYLKYTDALDSFESDCKYFRKLLQKKH